MTMGETQVSERELQEDQHLGSCVRRDRRNALWNIFEGVEATVLHKLAGLSLEMVQELVVDSAHDTVSECLSHLPDSRPESTSSASDGQWCCEPARLQRSCSTTAGEEIQAALQNRQRRNAVGNLFDLLTASQKLLLVEHLQEQMERLHSFHTDVSGDNGQVVLSLADLTSTSSSSSSSSTVSSPRSQGEIVCR